MYLEKLLYTIGIFSSDLYNYSRAINLNSPLLYEKKSKIKNKNLSLIYRSFIAHFRMWTSSKHYYNNTSKEYNKTLNLVNFKSRVFFYSSLEGFSFDSSSSRSFSSTFSTLSSSFLASSWAFFSASSLALRACSS